jgi:endo-1,4-beta-xylanase
MKSRLAIHQRLFLALLLPLALATAISGRSAEVPALKDLVGNRFHIGTAINRSMTTGASNRFGAGRSPEQRQKDLALLKKHFNQVAPENDLKWLLIHPQPGPDGYDFGPADAFVNFGMTNDLYLVGHTLIWHSQTPFWVFAGTNLPSGVTNQPAVAATATNAGQITLPGSRRFGRGFGRTPYNGPRASREELLERMREHIHTVVGRYKGKIKCWDVVNEAIADDGTNILRNSLWVQIIGPEFIDKAFEYAHEADPQAILRYNDYGLENPEKRRKCIALIKSLQARKVPVMAIGSQTHVSVWEPGFAEEDRALTELEALGLPIHITELDVNSARGGQRNTSADVAANAAATQGGLVDDSDRRLVDAYADLFRAFLKHDSVKMVTFWGLHDGLSWRADGRPLLFTAQGEPKPAFHAVVAEAKKAAAAKPSKP